jgi:hypothetical protein
MDFDVYGEPIKLHYKSSTEFKTYTGGIMSLLTYLIMTGIAVAQVMRLRYDYNPMFAEY